MSNLLKLLLLALLALVVRSLLSSWFKKNPQQVGGERKRSHTKVGGRMIKDPQCGTYVAADLAIPARTGGETIHFCSQKCRDSYFAQH